MQQRPAARGARGVRTTWFRPVLLLRLRQSGKTRMRTLKVNYLLAGTAIALVLAVAAGPVSATTTESQANGSAGTPEPAQAPPETTGQTTPQPQTPAAPAQAAPTEPTQPAPAPTTAQSTVPAADPLVERMRDISNGKFDRIFAGKKERSAVEAWYATRNFAPIW